MLAIISHIPLWIVPLLFGLIWLGLRATHERSVSPVLIYALPMMGLMSLNTTSGLPQAELALWAFFGGYLVAVMAGYTLQGRWIIARDARRVIVRGEWLTMATMLGIFGANFVNGMMQGRWPDLAASAGFCIGFGAVAGVMAGLFMGRALRVATWSHPLPT